MAEGSFESKLINKLKERLESGILMMGSAYADNWLSEKFGRKYLKEYSELGVGLGTAVVGDALGIKGRIGQYDRYLDMLMDGMSDYGFLKSVLDYKIVKVPFCYFKDTNTIRCINFDADVLAVSSNTYVTVTADDNSISVSSVSGTPKDFTIELGSAVSEGWHKLIVQAGNTKKDVFRGKSYAKA